LNCEHRGVTVSVPSNPPEKSDMTNDILEGACTCGAIRYRLTSVPLIVHACHCRWCQRESGSAFALNAMIEADRLELLQGEPILVDTPSASGRGQQIARCAQCHVALWSHYPEGGKAIAFVRVGTLKDPDRLSPDVHIYTSTRQPWVQLAPGTPAVDEFYDINQLWPPTSLARLAALRAAKHPS
jgi:hypothetical protein